MIIKKNKYKSGFTLIELIIVLGVLGIIALIAVPRYLQVQESSKKDADYGTAAAIAKAAEIYYANDSNLNPNPTIKNLKDGKYLNEEWSGWQYFTSNGTTAVYIEIKFDTGGTVGVYAGNSTSSGIKLYPKPE